MPAIKSLRELTPWDKMGGIYFKRDDLFQPFKCPLNGGKVRQALKDITENAEKIRRDYNSTVCTVSSIGSPQGYLITRCAAALELKTVIGIGATTPEKAVANYKGFRLAAELGAEIIKLADIGYNTTLQPRLEAMAKEKKFFPIKFGIHSHLDINSRQVENMPALDNLVIPCGSGVSASSILRGISEFPRNRWPKTIVVVQIAGIAGREKFIHSNLGVSHYIPFQFVVDKTYPYSKKVKIDHWGLEFDSIYESKAYLSMMRRVWVGSLGMWIIGNFNKLRS